MTEGLLDCSASPSFEAQVPYDLEVEDFAAYTKIRGEAAKIKVGQHEFDFSTSLVQGRVLGLKEEVRYTTLPIDRGPGNEQGVTGVPGSIKGDRIADIGWLAFTGVSSSPATVGDTRAPPDDEDPNPNHPAGTGDGLTAIEEYRGLVAGSTHRRLDPTKLDVFIRSSFPTGIAYAFPALPTNTHRLFAQNSAGSTGKVVNFNHPGLAHSFDQELIEVVIGINCPLGTLGCSDSKGTFDCQYVGTPAGQAQARVCTAAIQQEAQTYVQNQDPSQDPDILATRATQTAVAHEVGHGLTLFHYSGVSQSHPVLTIMAGFSPAPGVWFPNPPNQYDGKDLSTLLLR